ncbi:TetR/AcrR family transcriptional regulator [Agitococcus lubricus]|uniref:TetR family transcriptional regulator n=1 Tax=Agitococcus lubricus TaxID=1077255 RepID=A0A2T5IVQ7_9GAMM|nr:TetR/AcrR family transcriptional regulator [Agitococcus lubricus]PTQ87983.1 TetR family transcriptional regulator [Agitococcus lubricus]
MTEMTTPTRPQAILAAALACFDKYGIEGTTIEMIRQESNASVGSIYHHFGGKDEIAAALFIEGMRQFAQLLRERVNAAQTAEQGIKAIVYANVEWITDNPAWASYCFHHRGAVKHGKAAETFSAENKVFYQFIETWFRPHVLAGSIKLFAPPLMSALIIGATHDYARHWLAGRTKTTLEAYKEILADAAWQSIKNN